jgi:hypothetical protein
MAFNIPTSGAGWRLAGSLVQLGREIEAAHPDFTCLGTLGNAAHAAEGFGSDHNPFIKDPHTGVGVVRAIDIGGPDNALKQLRQVLWSLYAQQDDRVYRFGYMKGCSDNLINNWGLPFGTHIDTGDAGHLHISVTQANGNNPTAAGYVAALDDTRSWSIAAGVAAQVAAAVPVTSSGAPHAGVAWPGPQLNFGPHDFFGNINGPAVSHGGAFPAEKPFVKLIQQRLIALGFVPGVSATDTDNDWADGIFDIQGNHSQTGPTTDAVVAFQRAHMPGTKFFGQVWSDDWATLFGG